jgi:ectoine hydroxylase-related dioxygenase (phytanoyl-CoA dioxygenase family)
LPQVITPTSGSPSIRHFAPTQALDASKALQDDGVVVLDGLFGDGRAAAVMRQIAPALRPQAPGGGAFYGGRTKRLAGLFAYGNAIADIVADQVLLSLIDPVLTPHCLNYRLGLTAALEVWPGGALQPLHRDSEVYAPFYKPDHEVLVSVMIAGTDFTRANGGTRIAPGSHRWPRDQVAEESDIVQLEMSAGSVALWLGSVIHGLAINHTDAPRLGIPLGYALGWLRQEQEQFLVVPPEAAKALPEAVRRIIGYQTHGPVLGWVDGNQFAEDGAADFMMRSRLLA